jgi:phytoene synthase
MATETLNLDEAYRYCEALMRKRESNFSLGFQFLPEDKKRAIHVVYAFCRFVDDVSDEAGDGTGAGDPRALLGRWTEELDRVYRKGEATHPISAALLDVLKRYPIPRDGFQELVDGCVRDQEFKRYPDFKTLTGYCDLVATSIAKVSLPVYGFKADPRVLKHGRDLSFAFQLTNILRDVSEDLERGRVYLPLEDFTQFGLTPESVVSGACDPAKLEAFYRFEGARCEEYFKSGWEVLEYLESDSRPCVKVMWAAYHRLLEKILADPRQSLKAQTILTPSDKTAITESLQNRASS